MGLLSRLIGRERITYIAGIRFDNDDGSSRLELLKRCTVGDYLNLKHVTIKEDKNAVKVLMNTGEQIGWLSRPIAAKYARRLDKGEGFETEINYISRWINGARCKIKITKT